MIQWTTLLCGCMRSSLIVDNHVCEGILGIKVYLQVFMIALNNFQWETCCHFDTIFMADYCCMCISMYLQVSSTHIAICSHPSLTLKSRVLGDNLNLIWFCVRRKYLKNVFKVQWQPTRCPYHYSPHTHSHLLNTGNPQILMFKLFSLKAHNTRELANIFRSDPQEEKKKKKKKS